tara:strand:+ start:2971 stop:3381 length:411 start_codon:yes stop_codon:yes gene_type:complete
VDKDRIRTVLHEEEANLTDIIDMVIEDNGIIGVGLITLAEQLSNYVLYGMFNVIPRPKHIKFADSYFGDGPDLISSEFDKTLSTKELTTEEKLQAKGYNLDELDKDNPYVYPYGEFRPDEDAEVRDDEDYKEMEVG